MKSIILVLAMIGIIFIAVGYVKSNLQCPPPKIEYRYISKTFEDEQNVKTPILSLGGMYSMFEDDSPWIQDNSYATTDVKKKQ
jgi:hypothetical protein